MAEKESIHNISSFFELSKYQYRIFDMGRKLQRLSNQQFKRIEMQQEKCPAPFRQQIWLGILFWRSASLDEPVIWFLRFPIDETGLLQLESRDSFIRNLLEQVGDRIKQQAGLNPSMQEGLRESPFAFKPSQDKMAIFNALATLELKRPASRYYAHALSYLKGECGYEQWSFVGLQGLADVVARSADKPVQQVLLRAIPELPAPPLVMLARLLEHCSTAPLLARALASRLEAELDKEISNPALVVALLRSLSSSADGSISKQAVLAVLQGESGGQIEVIAAIALRCWQTLESREVMLLFLERLALHEQQQFDAVLLDLFPVPGMRELIMKGLRETDRSAGLSEKIGGFMRGFDTG